MNHRPCRRQGKWRGNELPTRGIGPSCHCRLGQSGIDTILRSHLTDPSCWDQVELGRWVTMAEKGML